MIELGKLEKNKLVTILASILYDYLSKKDVCIVGDKKIDRSLIDIFKLAERSSYKEVVLGLARDLVKENKEACLDFIKSYVDKNCLFTGKRGFDLAGIFVNVEFKDCVVYKESFTKKTEFLAIYSSDRGYVVEIPKVIQVDFGFDFDDSEYEEIRREIFVEQGRIKSLDGSYSPGIVLLSFVKRFIIPSKSLGEGKAVKGVEKRKAELKRYFEILGVIHLETLNDVSRLKFVPIFKLFKRNILFYVEYKFLKGELDLSLFENKKE